MQDSYNKRLLNIGICLLDPFTTAKTKHKMQCMICDHVWAATPISKIQNHKKYQTNGCPLCNENRKAEKKQQTRNEFIQKILDRGFTIISEYNGQQTTQDKITVINNSCGHQFATAPGNIIHRSVECPTCNTIKKSEKYKNINKLKHERWAETASEWELYKSKVRSLTRLMYNENKSRINPNNLPSGIAGIDGAHHLDHIFPVRWCFDHNVPVVNCADVSNLQFIPWEDNIHKSKKILKGNVPIAIQPFIGNDVIVDCMCDVEQILTKAGVDVQRYSDVMAPYIVHLYIPTASVAIRFYDITVESEQYTGSKKVQCNLLYLANTKSIKLLQIFSDELINDRQLVIRKILHYIGNNSNERIHARKCEVRVVEERSEVSNFLKINHTQGNDDHHIAVGAYHDRVLVAVMTFCKPRLGIGKSITNKPNTWELSRFAIDVDVRIPGIASKLLKYFKCAVEWSAIYSYADKRWSVGNVYIQLGFNLVGDNSPSYWYVVDGKRKHRWQFRKSILSQRYDNFDSSKTEYQMMLEQGIDRIWDCGTLKYQVNNME